MDRIVGGKQQAECWGKPSPFFLLEQLRPDVSAM